MKRPVKEVLHISDQKTNTKYIDNRQTDRQQIDRQKTDRPLLSPSLSIRTDVRLLLIIQKLTKTMDVSQSLTQTTDHLSQEISPNVIVQREEGVGQREVGQRESIFARSSLQDLLSLLFLVPTQEPIWRADKPQRLDLEIPLYNRKRLLGGLGDSLRRTKVKRLQRVLILTTDHLLVIQIQTLPDIVRFTVL